MIKIDLEKIPNEVAQTATEATKVVSLSILPDENCLDFLEQKRNITDLVYSSKMMNNITPPLLSSLVRQSVRNGSRYSLRNANDLQTGAAAFSQ